MTGNINLGSEKINNILRSILSVGLGLTMFYYYLFGRIGMLEIRSIFLTVMLILCFLPKGKESIWVKLIDYSLCTLSIITNVYFIANHLDMKRAFIDISTTAIVMGCILILLILEGTRRKLGWAMPAIASIFILYGFFGYLIPGRFAINRLSIQRIINILYTGAEGIYGTALGTMTSMIFLFIFFGSLLMLTGAGDFFINLSKALFGKVAGGPAKIAVVSSMLFGSISGSAVANVLTTGSITIPMMKKTGYTSALAGAIEATASTGGHLMPPIMGAGAFLIAEMVGVPYSTVALVSIVPAFMYYFSIFLTVHLEAKKNKLLGLSASEIPKVKDTIKESGLTVLPLVMLIGLMLFGGYSLGYSAMLSIITLIIINLPRTWNRNKGAFIYEAIMEGIKSSVSIAMACSCAGLIIGIIILTGVGYNFSSALLNISSGSLFLALFLVFIMGLILGVGMTNTASFILMVSVAGGGLTGLGLPILSAYIITYWFSQTAGITPPVCLTAYAAAGLAEEKPMKVGMQSLRLGFPLLIMPFLMAYRSILFTGTLFDSLFSIFCGTGGIFMFSAFFAGYLRRRFKPYEYALALIGGIGLFWPNYIGDLVGFISLVSLVLSQFLFHKKELLSTRKGRLDGVS